MPAFATVRLNEVWAMLEVCAKGYTKREKEHTNARAAAKGAASAASTQERQKTTVALLSLSQRFASQCATAPS